MWIAEGTWEVCVDAAAELLSQDVSITLVHVAAAEVEAVATGAFEGLLGRRPRRAAAPQLEAVSEAEAQRLLELAQKRLGRDAGLISRRGRVEREVIEAARGADMLVLARAGVASRGPRSLGPAARFVLDHAPCPPLLVPGTDGPPPAGGRGRGPGDRGGDPGGGPGGPGGDPGPPPGQRPPHPPLPSGGR